MWFASVLAGVACFSGAVLCQTKLKFMPLGDSITEITCWRALLWDNLVAAGVSGQVQFVGSTTSNTMNCRAKDTAWDKRHEGHSGFLAVDIARNNLPGWLRLNQPDIVNFMLGTNDVSRGKTTAEVINAYTSIVTQLRAANPKVKIIIDTVIPLSFGQAGITAINNQIPAWAAQQNKTGSPIYVLDVANGYPASANRDGVHPGAQGDQIIASKLSPLLIQLIKESIKQ